MNDTRQHNEQTRLEVLSHLAQRPAVAQSAAVVHRHVRLIWPCEIEHIISACAMLCSKGYLRSIAEDLGSTEYYQATADGVLAWERRA